MMNIEIIISSFSVLVAFANSVAVAAMYIKYVRSIRGVFCSLKVDESGNVEIIDSLTKLQDME